MPGSVDPKKGTRPHNQKRPHRRLLQNTACRSQQSAACPMCLLTETAPSVFSSTQKKHALLRSSGTRALSSTDSLLWEYAVSACRTYRRLLGIFTVQILGILLMLPPKGVLGLGQDMGAPARMLQGSKLAVGLMPGPETPASVSMPGSKCA